MEDEKYKLEKYRILNERINSEINEIYLVNSVFLVVNSGLFAASIFKDNLIVLKIFGFIVSLLWFLAILTSYNWKEYWMREIQKMEGEDFMQTWQNLPRISPSLKSLFIIISVLFAGVWFFSIFLQSLII